MTRTIIGAGLAAMCFFLGAANANLPPALCLGPNGKPTSWLEPKATPEFCAPMSGTEQDYCQGEPEQSIPAWRGSYLCEAKKPPQAPDAVIAVRFTRYSFPDIWFAVPRGQLPSGRYEAYGTTPFLSRGDIAGTYYFDAAGKPVAADAAETTFMLFLSTGELGALTLFADGKTPAGYEKTGERDGLAVYGSSKGGGGYLIARETPWGLVGGDCSTTVVSTKDGKEVKRHMCTLGWRTNAGFSSSLSFYDDELKNWRKIVGAATYHTHGMDRFPELLPKVRDVNITKRNVLFAVGILENAYDETSHVEIVPSEKLATREPELQAIAKRQMPQIYFDDIDVLVIDEMGKNISGAGFDPNITGRNRRAVNWSAKPMVKKIVVLGLTKITHGNATGLGSADVITMRLYKELDIPSTYANIITSMNLDGAAIPMIMNTDHDAIALAVKTVVRVKPENCRIVRIRNTLHLGEIEVSEAMLSEVRSQPDKFEILEMPRAWSFDAQGTVAPLLEAVHAAA